MNLDNLSNAELRFPALLMSAIALAEGTNANTFKLTNAAQFTIGGLVFNKAATDNLAFSTTKPGGAAVEAVAVGSHCFILAQINAAGTITTVQGDINGGIPVPDYVGVKPTVVATAAAPITLSVTGADIIKVNKTAHGFNVGDRFAFGGLSQSGHQAMNSVPVHVTRRIDADNFEIDIAASKVPLWAVGQAYTANAQMKMISAGLCPLGVIRVAPGSNAFTPGSSDLGAAGMNPVYWDIFGGVPFDRL